MTRRRSSLDVGLAGEVKDERASPLRTQNGRCVPRHLAQLVVLSALVALLAIASAVAANPPDVVLNEVNCTGTDWVEVINGSNAELSIANWLLTDDALDRVPLRASHRWRFAPDAVLAPGGRLVVSAGTDGLPFGLSCGDDTLRLADGADTLVDSVVLPVLAGAGMTYGRIPDGTGDWTWTVPTAGAANAAAPDTQAEDPAWLYDPLQVTEIDLEASPAALSQLAAVPDQYVDARITMRSGSSTYGPYLVGLRLKGHGAFRSLEGKAAFKVKFAYAVAGQRFGLKGLTLNNMVQDPSMIAEATSSLLVAATGAPTARVGYAYVRLNDADYGLYANVETVDAVMAQRFFTGTQHLYEANQTNDVSPGSASLFEVDEGSTGDRSDLDALSSANAGGAGGWWERMQPVADLVEMTRAWAAEHYAGHWDGYSVGVDIGPNNYYLHSDLAGRFALVVSGTDQTWMVRSAFGAYGTGLLMRACVADVTCRQLYVDALREIPASPSVAALPAKARAIRAAIAPWRARDPRREQSVTEGEARADAAIAMIDARTAELDAWLAAPSFVDALQQPESGGGDVSVDSQSPPPTPIPPPPSVAPQTRSAQTLVVRPLLGKPVAASAKPVAGRQFTLSLPVTRSDTGALLVTGRMECAPTLGGKLLRHTDSFRAGMVRLSFVVPKTAEGKLLKVEIEVTASGKTAGRIYTFRVR